MKIVFTTLPDEEKAKSMARSLVEKRLAACVWIIPNLKSFYIWEGKLEEDIEFLLVAKTIDEKADELIKAIRDIHPYKVPEIIALNADYVLPEYLKWAEEVCKK